MGYGGEHSVALEKGIDGLEFLFLFVDPASITVGNDYLWEFVRTEHIA